MNRSEINVNKYTAQSNYLIIDKKIQKVVSYIKPSFNWIIIIMACFALVL